MNVTGVVLLAASVHVRLLEDLIGCCSSNQMWSCIQLPSLPYDIHFNFLEMQSIGILFLFPFYDLHVSTHLHVFNGNYIDKRGK